MDKKVVILITSAPHGDIYSYEAIRAAAGIMSGDIELAIFFIGKGTLNLLKLCEKEKFKFYFEALEDMEIPIYGCKEDIEEMGLKLEDMIKNVKIEERIELARKCHLADISLNF